jgi:outer membrane protein
MLALSAFVVAAAAAAAAEPATPPQPLTVDQAIALALETSPRLRAARSRAQASHEQVKSHRGRLLPSIYVSDEQQHWDRPFAIPFGPASVVARSINDNTFTAAANQPILGLVKLYKEQSALSASAEAAREDARAVEAALKEEVQNLFLQLYEARALAGIARSSQAQLSEHIQVAKDKLKAGVLTLADILRLETALANARQQEIQAAAAEQVARSGLLLDLGRPADDQSLEFVEPSTPDRPMPGERPLGSLIAQAVAVRPELKGAMKQAESAEDQATARTLDLWPDVNLEGGYVHIHGNIFAPENAAFVGVKAEWLVWDWGARYFGSRAAARQATAAESQANETRRLVQLDVAAKLSSLRAAAAALESARTGIASAEEAYRVTSAQVSAGSASTTDLLDAQSALTQARLNFARARYAQAIASVSLSRAVGEP